MVESFEYSFLAVVLGRVFTQVVFDFKFEFDIIVEFVECQHKVKSDHQGIRVQGRIVYADVEDGMNSLVPSVKVLLRLYQGKVRGAAGGIGRTEVATQYPSLVVIYIS